MRAERGMTLLELLVVLVILGFVSGLGVTAYAGRPSRQADRFANEVCLFLHAARRQALDSGQVVRIRLTERSISAQPSDPPIALQARAGARVRWAVAGARHSDPMFYADGSAVSGTFDIDLADVHRRIEIDWAGEVRDVASQR